MEIGISSSAMKRQMQLSQRELKASLVGLESRTNALSAASNTLIPRRKT